MNPVESSWYNLNEEFPSDLEDAEQQTLQRLQPLLAHSPQDLLAILLGQGQVTGAVWEWAAPLPLARAHDE